MPPACNLLHFFLAQLFACCVSCFLVAWLVHLLACLFADLPGNNFFLVRLLVNRLICFPPVSSCLFVWFHMLGSLIECLGACLVTCLFPYLLTAFAPFSLMPVFLSTSLIFFLAYIYACLLSCLPTCLLACLSEFCACLHSVGNTSLPVSL